MTALPDRTPTSARTPELFGHPRGLAFLFATEMWERFSYYGMRALLVLYMVKYLLLPGRAENVDRLCRRSRAALEAVSARSASSRFASQIYGLYTAFVYLTPIIGGLLADRVLGQRRTVIIGAVLMAIGHFMMAFEPLLLFALLTLILGNGAFKPNISTQVGGLYAPGDPRRDRAFSIFYVGINLGAFFSPLVCGTLGEALGWHYGFAAAGVGMLIGLAIYLRGLRRSLPPDELANGQRRARDTSRSTRDEWRAHRRALVLFLPVTLFWATYEQQGNTIALWADDYTDRSVNLLVWRGEIPADLVPGVQPVHDLRLHAASWSRCGRWQARRGSEPSTVTKMALGCFGVALANLHHGVAAASRPAAGKRAGCGCSAISSSSPSASFTSRRSGFRSSPRSRPPRVALDDDGRVAGHELRRQFHRRLARQLLEQHGQAGLLPDDRRDRRRRRRRDPRVQRPLRSILKD